MVRRAHAVRLARTALQTLALPRRPSRRVGHDLTWPLDKGLEGNRNDGWFLNIAENEIENLRIEKIDIRERARYRQTFKTNPPEDLFIYVRPATDQEWIRE